MHYLGIQEIDEESTFKQPLFEVLPEAEQCKFLYSIAKGILKRYIKMSDVLGAISHKTQELDMQSVHINGMFDEHQKKFICQSCEKKYKTFLGIKKHRSSERTWIGQFGGV